MCPITLMCEEPSFPHVLVSSWYPPVPNPILESQEEQIFSLPRIPILALAAAELEHMALNPSLLQLVYKKACEPISDFHVSRPSDVAR